MLNRLSLTHGELSSSPLIQTLTKPRGGATHEIPQQGWLDFVEKRMAADLILFHLKTG